MEKKIIEDELFLSAMEVTEFVELLSHYVLFAWIKFIVPNTVFINSLDARSILSYSDENRLLNSELAVKNSLEVKVDRMGSITLILFLVKPKLLRLFSVDIVI